VEEVVDCAEDIGLAKVEGVGVGVGVSDGVGVGAGTEFLTPLLHTYFFPDFRQVYVYPFTMIFWFNLIQGVPAFGLDADAKPEIIPDKTAAARRTEKAFFMSEILP
jgi:hypothetical protein